MARLFLTCVETIALAVVAAACGSSSSAASACQTGTIVCQGGMNLQFCQNSSDTCTYFVGIGTAIPAGYMEFSCESCDDLSYCQSLAVAYCQGAGTDAGVDAATSSDASATEPCGSACPEGSSCEYTIDEGVQSPTDEGPSCAVACSGGSISAVSAAFGTNCSPEPCSGAVSSCLGSSSCSVQMTTASCGGDPCPGTPKSGSINITCSTSSSSTAQPCCAPFVSCGDPPCPSTAPNCNQVDGNFGPTGQYACYPD